MELNTPYSKLNPIYVYKGTTELKKNSFKSDNVKKKAIQHRLLGKKVTVKGMYNKNVTLNPFHEGD